VAESATDPIKGIPQFWFTALQNNPYVAQVLIAPFSGTPFPEAFKISSFPFFPSHVDVQMIEEHDEPVLEHLMDVAVEYLAGDEKGYRLHFTFSPNEFFQELVRLLSPPAPPPVT
jgi:hypothetical protein